VDRQTTNMHADTLIAIFHTPSREQSNKVQMSPMSFQSINVRTNIVLITRQRLHRCITTEWLMPNFITVAGSELVQSWLRTGSEHASDQIPVRCPAG